jgi:CheY-like chemotaxis protein
MVDLQASARNTHNAPLVLVIEDDGLIRQMLCAVFEAQDWVTNEASNGEQGLEQLEEIIPNLIVLDLMMPVMDGFAFAKILRQKPTYRDVPVIVLTAMILDEHDRARLTPHVQGIIEKGGSPNYLYNLLTQAKQFMH